ncbi:hypothetical protein [Streptomyces zaomyceticus]|uniref:hypothetical protein n=1 Tax=Streptomyces zaomyceticus TaxID=68286 RepID=UPI0037B1E1BB
MTDAAPTQPTLATLTEEQLADLIAEADAYRNQPQLRHCLVPSCLREFDAMTHMAGDPPSRPSWSGDGWRQLGNGSVVPRNGRYVCPDHAEAVIAHLPRRVETVSGRWTAACACGWAASPQRWYGLVAPLWEEHLLIELGDLPPAPPVTDPEHRTPIDDHTEQSLAELYDRCWDAEGELGDRREAAQAVYRSLQEHRDALTEAATRSAGVHNALLVIRSMMATSSRDWLAAKDDAWLYGVLMGWDCEQQHTHTEDCSILRLEDVAAKHGWSTERVARIRKFRATLAKAGPNGETDAAVRREMGED